MNKLRDAIVDTFRAKFPEMAPSIQPFIGLLDEQSERQISYAAPGILVCILPSTEVPEAIAPWEIQAEIALVISVKQASAIERDIAGWALSTKVAKAAYRNCWGMNRQYIRPAILTNWAKNVAREPDGTPTGVNYWTIQLYNWMQFEGLI